MPVETEIVELKVLDIDEHAAIADIAAVRNMLEAYMARGREMMKELDKRMIGWIQANGAIEWPVDDEGHVLRFFLAVEKETRCRDAKRAIEEFLSVGLDEMMTCLSVNAIKPGAAKKLLAASGRPELFLELFEVVEKTKIKGEAGEKTLQSVNTKFLGIE